MCTTSWRVVGRRQASEALGKWLVRWWHAVRHLLFTMAAATSVGELCAAVLVQGGVCSLLVNSSALAAATQTSYSIGARFQPALVRECWLMHCQP